MEKTKVYITTQRAIPLGYQGEGEVREIIFRPPVELLEENWTLMHQRQDDDEPYPVPLTVTSDSLTWTVTSGDTAQSGTGLTQLICMDAAGSVLKSMIYQTSVARSMDVTGDVPDPVEPWYNSLTEQIGKAGTVKSVNHVEPDESGNVQLDISGGGGSGTAGEDGFSPTATVTQTDDGAVITITDKSGITTATVTNGKDGAQGPKGDKGDTGATGAQGPKGDTGATGAQGPKGDTGATGPAGADGKTPVKGTDYWTESDKEEIVEEVVERVGSTGGSGTVGEDGYSPTATVTQTDEGAVITITDKSSTTTATVTNGKDGAQGPKGDTGAAGAQGPQGPAGADGKTPVKGTDYWTEADKDEIRDENITYLSSQLAKRQQLSPEYADDISSCTDISKLYVLPDGFIYAYILGESTGTKTETVSPVWQLGVKLDKSTGAESSGGQYTACEPIYIADGETYVFSVANNYYLNGVVCWYGSSGNYLGYTEMIASASSNGAATSATLKPLTGAGYFRLRLYHIWDASSNPTLVQAQLDEAAMTKTVQEASETYGWNSTGHAFVPADYEDRIVSLESAVNALKGDMSIFGIVDGQKQITLTGALEEGTYTIQYQDVDDQTVDIGSFWIGR